MLLLDEVLAGLVPAERQPMIELLRELHGDGLTVLFVEHIMAAVMALSQRLLVMHEGRSLALGDPQRGRPGPARRRGLPGRGALTRMHRVPLERRRGARTPATAGWRSSTRSRCGSTRARSSR